MLGELPSPKTKKKKKKKPTRNLSGADHRLVKSLDITSCFRTIPHPTVTLAPSRKDKSNPEGAGSFLMFPIVVARTTSAKRGVMPSNPGLSLLCLCPAFEVPRGPRVFLGTDNGGGWGLWWDFSLFPVWKIWPRVGCEMGAEAALATSVHTWVSDLLLQRSS